MHKEHPFAHSIQTDIKGHSVSKTVKHIFYEKDITMKNIVCTTDDAASMVGHYRGCIAFLKREVPNIRPLTAPPVHNI